MTSSIKAAFSVVLLGGLLGAQTATFKTLMRGVYNDAGLVAVDEVTVAAQTVGADGFRGSFDDSIALLRDIGGQWEVQHVWAGVMTPGLISLGGGMLATVSSGVDGQIGTLDDAVIVLYNCSTGTPGKLTIPMGGTFVGGPVLAQNVATEDLISCVAPMRVGALLAGSTMSPALLNDAVVFIDVSTGSPVLTYVDAGTRLMRSPPSPLTLPGSTHEVVSAHGVGNDLVPTTTDDELIVVERFGTGSWSTRSVMTGFGLVDGWARRCSRFSSDVAVGLAAYGESGAQLGFSPPSTLLPPTRVSLGFLVVTGMGSPSDPLVAKPQFVGEGMRWLPPTPSVRYLSAFLPSRSTAPHRLIEFTDLEAEEPSATWHVWTRGWSNEPVLDFYGQATPVATSYDGSIGTTDPQVGSARGWSFAAYNELVSDSVVINDGLVVQLSDFGLGMVNNVALGGMPSSLPNPPGKVLARSMVRLSGGSLAALSAGPDSIVGNSDDGITVWSGLAGVSVLGHGHPERPDGGPRIRVADRLYPSAVSSATMTVIRDQAGSAAPGSWRWGFLVVSPMVGFDEFAWGRSFLSYLGLWQLTVVDPMAGVGSTGSGVSYVPLPGNAGLAGIEAGIQWIVHNPQSPWQYDTSNGLHVRFGF